LSIDGTIYNQQEIVYHDVADLALVRYDKALPGHYSLYTGELVPQGDPKLSVLMVGYGTIGSVFSTFWTDNGSGRGTQRWGSQEIDRKDLHKYPVDGRLTVNRGFWMDFDLGNTDNESGAGIGDSGGGTFYNDGGIWKLVGINTARSASGGEYDATFSVSMPYYYDWVLETIPEPGAISLIGLSAVGLFLAHTKRRRKLPGASLLPIRREGLCDTFRTLEEPEAHGRVLKGTSDLAGLKQAIKPRLLAAWNNVHVWHKGLDKMFWNHMVVTRERRTARENAIKSTLKKKALNGFDAFLAWVMK